MSDDYVKTPQRKRPATDMANSSALNESITTMITNIKASDDPSIKDLVNLFTSYIELQLEKERKDKETIERISHVEEKSVIHEKQIQDLQEITYGMQISSSEVNKNILTCEASIHKLEQMKIENDLFFSQIPFKPNVEEISKKILETTNISHSALLNCYTFPMRAVPAANSTQTKSQQQQKPQSHAIVITLNSHADKMKFFAERKKLGPIKITQLLQSTSSEIADKSIRYSNRLSTFNLKALKTLHAAKGAGLVHAFQLHNGLFRIKRSEKGKWSYVGTYIELANLQPLDVSMGEK